MVYNNTSFYYVRDILANIIGIVDNNSKFVVKYTYDAFGKILTTTGDLKDTLGKDRLTISCFNIIGLATDSLLLL